jgi:ZIP family zinc transporter
MLGALLWGLVSTSSLVLGGIIGVYLSIGNRMLGIIMAFGAGVLISAVAYDLVYESLAVGKGTGGPSLGIALGALTFYLGDKLVSGLGATNHMAIRPASQAALLVPMMLGIMLDGIPESLVLGVGILEGGSISLAMLVAIFISNLPEAIAGTAGMRAGGWSNARIFTVWGLIAGFCALISLAGFALFAGVSDFWLAFVQAFAAGAILTMLANSMMPEAAEHGGDLGGLFTVLGFSVAVFVVILEKAQGG